MNKHLYLCKYNTYIKSYHLKWFTPGKHTTGKSCQSSQHHWLPLVEPIHLERLYTLARWIHLWTGWISI